MLTDPTSYLDRKRQDADRLFERLETAEERLLSADQQKFVRLCASLDALSPLKVLSRGYSVVKNENGCVVSDAGTLREGDVLDVTMARGAVECRVEGIREERPEK